MNEVYMKLLFVREGPRSDREEHVFAFKTADERDRHMKLWKKHYRHIQFRMGEHVFKL